MVPTAWRGSSTWSPRRPRIDKGCRLAPVVGDRSRSGRRLHAVRTPACSREKMGVCALADRRGRRTGARIAPWNSDLPCPQVALCRIPPADDASFHLAATCRASIAEGRGRRLDADRQARRAAPPATAAAARRRRRARLRRRGGVRERLPFARSPRAALSGPVGERCRRRRIGRRVGDSADPGGGHGNSESTPPAVTPRDRRRRSPPDRRSLPIRPPAPVGRLELAGRLQLLDEPPTGRSGWLR